MERRHHKTDRLSLFARHLMVEWRRLKLPVSNETIVLAVSGGADSTGLLLGLQELSSAGKISVQICIAHLDHQLRAESRKDAKFVTALGQQFGYEVVVGRAKVKDIAHANGDNLEQAARRLRYDFLERTARRKRSCFVLTGHTMDDQAETVLLRLMRGSGGIGLSGMDVKRPISKGSEIQLVRLLLGVRRSETEDYCRSRKTAVLADEMNEDERFARVRVRKQLLPLMHSFNNRIVEALSRAANLLREDSDELVGNAADLLKAASIPPNNATSKVWPLDVYLLANAASPVRRRALRLWISEAQGHARRLEMVHLTAVEKLLQGTSGGRVVELPDGAKVRRRQGRLEFEAKND
jgi:tRNA(Ile)-lysidine synthase